MSETYIPIGLRRSVIKRANHRCEYCFLPNSVSFFLPHEVDHVIAEKHGGDTEPDNLAYACWRCNRHKGTDLGSFDPQTGLFSFLFNPRIQAWEQHLTLEEDRIVGLTPEGRTTVKLLQLNRSDKIAERRRLKKCRA
ncbi:MAG: HNH endonuclease [Blastocatellia bacterium]